MSVSGRPSGPTLHGDVYNDDRMFVMYLCRCTVHEPGDGTVVTSVYHQEIPQDAAWCVVTYRNTERYPAYRVDNFNTQKEAQSYVERVEPLVPLVSLGGRSPSVPLTFRQFEVWKRENGLREYDWRQMYVPGGERHRETFIQLKRQGA